MFKSRELSRLQARVDELEKQLKASNGKATKLEAELKAAKTKVHRFKAALDNLTAAIHAKAAEDGEEEEEPSAEDDEEDEDTPAAEDDEEPSDPSDEEEDEPAAEDDEDEEKTMRKSKAALAKLNRLPGKAQVKQRAEKTARQLVTRRLAAAGVDPIARDPKVKSPDSPETRSGPPAKKGLARARELLAEKMAAKK